MSEKYETNGKEKVVGFRFSNRTIDNINALLDMKLARNKTEAIDIALEHIVTEEKTKQMMRGFNTNTNAQTRPLTEIEGLFTEIPENPFART